MEDNNRSKKVSTGTVKFFKKEKGYGFIVSDKDKEEFFAHITMCKEELESGNRVIFEESINKKGKTAINIQKLE